MLHPIQERLENLTSRQIATAFYEVSESVSQAQLGTDGAALLAQAYERLELVCPGLPQQIHDLDVDQINQILNGFATAMEHSGGLEEMANTPARSFLTLLVLAEIKYRAFLAGQEIADWANASGVTGFDLLEAVSGPRFAPVRADLSGDNFELVAQAFMAVAETVSRGEEQENIEALVSAIVATRGPVGELGTEQLAMLNQTIRQMIDSEPEPPADPGEYSLLVLVMGRIRPARSAQLDTGPVC